MWGCIWREKYAKYSQCGTEDSVAVYIPLQWVTGSQCLEHHLNPWRSRPYFSSKNRFQLPSDIASYSIRAESSAAPLWKPKNSHYLQESIVCTMVGNQHCMLEHEISFCITCDHTPESQQMIEKWGTFLHSVGTLLLVFSSLCKLTAFLLSSYATLLTLFPSTSGSLEPSTWYKILVALGFPCCSVPGLSATGCLDFRIPSIWYRMFVRCGSHDAAAGSLNSVLTWPVRKLKYRERLPTKILKCLTLTAVTSVHGAQDWKLYSKIDPFEIFIVKGLPLWGYDMISYLAGCNQCFSDHSVMILLYMVCIF